MRTVINYLKPQTGNLPSEIFGIDVAINNFLKAFFKYSRQKEFFFFPGSDESVASLKEIASEGGVDFSKCAWIGPGAPEMALSGVDLLFRPDPNLADHIWRRLQMKERAYAVCSIVHTMSGERITGVIGDYLLAPTQEGDAIICPSTAIRDSIQSLWEIQGSYYAHRFKGKAQCPVELPVIPLGIHTERFASVSTPEKRKEQRDLLGVEEDEVVILYVGRLSYATKAHPLALFKAAELAALHAAPKKVRLVLYGFFMPAAMEVEFVRLAADACPHLAVDFIPNNDPRFPDGVWAAGDIFASLIDNIQESFGFTPIEAMACGLPAVVSNWDGYRDGVRHGVEGMLIPTISVPPGHNKELASHYFNLRNYGEYLIRNNQSVAVDIGSAAAAFLVLINDKNLRLKLGAQGRIRAAEYDWRNIIKRYEDLWEELAAKRKRAKLDAPIPLNWPAAHPSYPDPSSMFRAFPSQALLPELRVEMAGGTPDIELASRHPMNLYGLDMMLNEEMMSEMIAFLYKKPGSTLADIQKTLAIPDNARFMRSVAWFLKMGLMRVTGGA